jgi:hypothetical protein
MGKFACVRVVGVHVVVGALIAACSGSTVDIASPGSDAASDDGATRPAPDSAVADATQSFDGALDVSAADVAADVVVSDARVDAGTDARDAKAVDANDAMVIPDGCAANTNPIKATVYCGAGGYSPSYGTAPYVCAPELHFVSVYEAGSSGSHTRFGATVAFNAVRTGAILVLSSYEPVAWTVTLGNGASLYKVIVDGYYDSTITVPAGVLVENLSPDVGGACSYPNTGTCISAMEQKTGGKMASTSSCYVSDSILLE